MNEAHYGRRGGRVQISVIQYDELKATVDDLKNRVAELEESLTSKTEEEECQDDQTDSD